MATTAKELEYKFKVSRETKEVQQEVQDILDNSAGKDMLQIFQETINPFAPVYEIKALNSDHGKDSYKNLLKEDDYNIYPVDYIVYRAVRMKKTYIRIAEEAKKKAAEAAIKKPEEPKGKWDHLKEENPRGKAEDL